MGAILGVVGLGLVIRPFTPFLIADHPVLLGFLSGDLIAIGAGAAFARIGEAPLWLVVVAGAAGMVKFDWLAWWAGRQWGPGIIRFFTAGERAQRYTDRATERNPWIVRLAVVLAVLPGVPTAVVYAAAGWAGMRLTTFLLLDLVGAVLMTAVVAGLGYGLGQRAVDVVLVIDRYASVVSLTLIAVALLVPVVKRWIRRKPALVEGRLRLTPGSVSKCTSAAVQGRGAVPRCAAGSGCHHPAGTSGAGAASS
jgi:membrane protein DedA with SNARE-associated domain